ncbi:MAG: hypothetical protein CFE45_21605 [Burkholderiales bacterium PBB5]|nr:MAG: hypothetical protein CFE45_21605 [Burkholderiales bacterium PBB5]
MSALRVLVVEDDPLNVELATFVLEEAAFVVDTVAEATEVLAKVAAFRPDLVLMDIQLPGGDGLTLTRALKADPATRGVVVVAFTAHAMKGDRARLLAAGCDAYIAKPIDVAAFAGQVRAAAAAGQASS